MRGERFDDGKNSKFVYYKCLIKTAVKIASIAKIAKDVIIAVFAKNAVV